jgi:hypothetical protein
MPAASTANAIRAAKAASRITPAADGAMGGAVTDGFFVKILIVLLLGVEYT